MWPKLDNPTEKMSEMLLKLQPKPSLDGKKDQLSIEPKYYFISVGKYSFTREFPLCGYIIGVLEPQLLGTDTGKVTK